MPTPRCLSVDGAGCNGSALTTTPASFLPLPPTMRPICRRVAGLIVAEEKTSCGGGDVEGRLQSVWVR
eukprot:5867205-Pleurochrysis_carterae.AAC.1